MGNFLNCKSDSEKTKFVPPNYLEIAA